MKTRHVNRFITVVMAGLLLLRGGCGAYDDSELRDKLAAIDSRLAALEARVNENVTELARLVAAVEGGDHVTGVTALADGSGYEITFSKSGRVTIKHGTNGADGADGTNGADGATPLVGAREEGGVYYWTLDGEWITGSDGKPLPVTGSAVAPRVRVNAATNEWEISTDDGQAWTTTGVKATGPRGEAGTPGESLFSGVDDTDPGYVLFTLAGGGVIKAWKYKALGIDFLLDGPFTAGRPRTVGYTLSGGATIVKEFNHTAPGWSVTFNTPAREMTITPPDAFTMDNYRDTVSLWLSDGTLVVARTFVVEGVSPLARVRQVAAEFLQGNPLPRSFIGPADHVADPVQRQIAERGTVLYDAAVLVKALLLYPPENADLTGQIVNALKNGQNVRANADFTYDTPVPAGSGYFYKIIDVEARWLSGQTQPITGENAWVANAMASVHEAYPGTVAGDNAYTLLAELARAIVALQLPGGLVRMAPAEPNNYAYLGIDYHATVSTENNISCIPVLRYMSEHGPAAERAAYSEALGRLEDAVLGMYNPVGGYFYTGRDLSTGAVNTKFATDCQTWIILALGPERLDNLMMARYGVANTSLQLLDRTLDLAGVTREGTLVGLDFSDRASVVSFEWSSGFVVAARQVLARYASQELQEAVESISAYIASQATATGLLPYTDSGEFVDTGHGWTVIPRMHSLASSAWNIFATSTTTTTPLEITTR
jgi:hypothetical protein